MLSLFKSSRTVPEMQPEGTREGGLPNVVIALFQGNGSSASFTTTTTDSNGDYEFCGLPAGTYVVLEFNLNGYDDVSDSDGPNDNRIRVVLGEGAKSPDHDFVDERVPLTLAPTPVGGTTVPTSGSPAVDRKSTRLNSSHVD